MTLVVGEDISVQTLKCWLLQDFSSKSYAPCGDNTITWFTHMATRFAVL
jgi:hypothetical protein